MRILVFGASGFLGSRFSYLLSAYELVAVARNPSRVMAGLKCYSYSDAEINLVNTTFDFAIDFSSHVSVEDFIEKPQQTFLDNISIPLKNLKFLTDIGFRGRYVYISTDRALTNEKKFQHIGEIVINKDPYGASKLFGEMIAIYLSGLGVFVTTVINFPNLYGPGQHSKQFVPSIIKQLKDGRTEITVGSLNGGRNYLYIDDAIDALKRFLFSPEDKNSFSVSGNYIKLSRIASCIEKYIIKKNLPVVKINSSGETLGRARYSSPPEFLDDSWFRQTYDWTPKMEIEQGIEQTLFDEGIL
jgi:nucleoside-diphosphate-sugar epimerase